MLDHVIDRQRYLGRRRQDARIEPAAGPEFPQHERHERTADPGRDLAQTDATVAPRLSSCAVGTDDTRSAYLFLPCRQHFLAQRFPDQAPISMNSGWFRAERVARPGKRHVEHRLDPGSPAGRRPRHVRQHHRFVETVRDQDHCFSAPPPTASGDRPAPASWSARRATPASSISRTAGSSVNARARSDTLAHAAGELAGIGALERGEAQLRQHGRRARCARSCRRRARIARRRHCRAPSSQGENTLFLKHHPLQGPPVVADGKANDA